MQRAPVSGRARLGGASARRHSRLHRWATQRLPARRGAAILHPISQHAARIEGMALCTRARRVRIARRGDRTVNYVRAMPGQRTVRRPRTVPLFDACIPFRRKADTGPDGGIPQTAPAEHALVTQRHRSAFLQRNRRSGPTQRAFRRRTHATSYYERSRCCPGPTVIRTRRGLPSAAHQTKRPLLRTTPPRPRNAQGHFERRRRRGPETHK